MPIRRRAQALFLLSILVAASTLVAAQQGPLSTRIPADPQITVGRLPNGLRYYIRRNAKPEQRAELRLVVNAGSLLEDDDQKGLAHFVEHMAFNGTKNFPKQALVDFLESIGMRFGADVNAGTNFDDTTFMLQVPTDKPAILDRSILILEDWAHNVTFEPAEIDKERGVVLEEWRLGRGAEARLQDKQFPILLKGSRYADRLPIGDPDILRTFKHDRLTAFYKDWYRPDVMAVVAVGDFDPAVVEALVKSHFSGLAAPKSPKTRTVFPVPSQPGTSFAIASDKEMPSTTVEVYAKYPAEDQTTIGSYRRQIVNNLFGGLLSARFGEMTQKPDAPFLAAGTGRGSFVRSAEATSLSALVKEDGVARGLEALFAETARVAQFGFTASELDRQKQNILRGLERAVAEKDKQASGGLADEYVRNFLTNEPIPGIVYEHQLYQRFLPEITLAELNALAKTWMPETNRVVVVSAPDKTGLKLPTAAELSSAMTGAAAKPLTAYVDAVGAAPFFSATPTPGTVTKTATKDAVGITEWTLSNGARVVLKPTDFKQDEILFRATSPGGNSLASDADFVAASSAAQLIAAGGLGQLSSIELRKALTGKIASASPFIDELTEGLSGAASPKDLETLFQIIYLRFTAPRADPVIFNTMITQSRAVLANQAADPAYAFFTTLQSVLSQDHPRSKPMTVETLDKMNLDTSLAFYKDRFADASDFTFLFIGSFDPAVMKPLVEKYLASLPATHRTETWKDVGRRTPTTVVERTVRKGLEPKSQAAIIFSGPAEYNQTQRVAMRALGYVLNNRLRERLREDLGGTYSVNASGGLSRDPRQEYTFDIEFGCDPQRVEALVKTVFEEIEKLKASGPTEKELGDVRETFVRGFDQDTKTNGFWIGQIAAKYQYGEDPATLLAVPDYYRKIDAALVQSAAKTYLDMKRYVKVTLVPEK
ncbi:MAG: insulinase family protein [Acidobacteria bacterium]|nr:MAG: insulinase family protein [Acidobacteriota bacterium]